MEKIYSPGEKLKNIRKRLKLKQGDVTSGEITRNLISAVEHNKATLTLNTAKTVVKNINKYCKENNIDCHVDIDYLMETKSEQAIKKLDRLLNDLDYENSITDEVMNKIDNLILLVEENDRKIKFLEEIADFLFEKKCYIESFSYYNQITPILVDYKESLANIYYKLGRVSFYLKKYKQCIYFSTTAINILETNNTYNDLYIKTSFNLALSYKKLENPSKTIEIFEKLNAEDKLLLSIEQKINILILLGNAYKNDYKNALKCYEESLELNKDKKYMKLLALTYINMAIVYKEMKQLDKALYYANLSLDIRETYQKEKVNLTLYYVGKIYTSLKEYENAKIIFKKILISYGYELKDGLKIKIYLQLLELYIKTEDLISIYSIIGIVESEFNQYEYKNDDIYSNVELFYLNTMEFLFNKDDLTVKRLLTNLKRGKINKND